MPPFGGFDPGGKIPRTRRKRLKQLGILNAAGVETLFPKEAMSLPNPTFYKTVNVLGYQNRNQKALNL